MIRNKIKILSILIITLSIISLNINLYAHSGRTDSSEGHKDNNNKSGLGSYHYHCGGYPAHLHTNGVCPYSYSSSSNQGSTSNSLPSTSTTIPTSNVNTNASVNTNTTVPSIITVDKIQINENIESIEVGESKILTVTVTPNDATDKSITWKSSDESIATVSKKGEIVAKKLE